MKEKILQHLKKLNRNENAIVVATALFILTLITLNILYGGWVFSLLWGWFVVPLTGWKAIGVAQSIGLLGTTGYIQRGMAREKKVEDKFEVNNWGDKLANACGAGFATATGFLLAGYFVSMFV